MIITIFFVSINHAKFVFSQNIELIKFVDYYYMVSVNVDNTRYMIILDRQAEFYFILSNCVFL